jgi:hypothetical protein
VKVRLSCCLEEAEGALWGKLQDCSCTSIAATLVSENRKE